MPEGPEVRRHADRIASAIEGREIVAIVGRHRATRAWLEAHGAEIAGRRVTSVRSHGKHLVGRIDSSHYFHSHLMMWGRWEVVDGAHLSMVDRRERARIATTDATAILYSAPVFEVGRGEPYDEIPHLSSLGPDALPYPDAGPFDAAGFLDRLLEPEARGRAIGAALLDQTIVAGLGNYLRAEILFECRIDPWREVEKLTTRELDCLVDAVPRVTRFAYEHGGRTIPDDVRDRMRDDATLVYQPGREYGTRHFVFRRTNLPCVECGGDIRQLRQVTREDDEGEKTRITYFCPTCQQTSVELPKRKRRARGEERAA
jgi:DNA-formamidopyrimidine glycosylase